MIRDPGRNAKVPIRMWQCAGCRYHNWPTRNSCRLCEAKKVEGALLVEELWNRSLVPTDCLAGNARAGGDGGCISTGSGPKGSGKVGTGKAAQPTGRSVLPSGRGEGREGGGLGDPRRGSPGVLDGGKGRKRKGSALGTAASENARTGGRDGKGGVREKGVSEGARVEGKKGKGEGGEGGGVMLPPEREFVRPAKTRESLVREVEAIEHRMAATAARDGTAGAVAQLQKEKEELEKSMRVAGGKTKRTLLFGIKNEEELQERSDRAIERCRARIREREEQIKEIQEGIRQDTILLERHKQRGQVAAQRLAFLTVQKVGESLLVDFIEKVRVAATVIKGSNDDRLQALEDFLEAMLPSTQSFHIGEDDGNSTVAGMDAGGRQDEEDIDLFDEERRQEIVVARARLAEEQRRLEQAIDGAFKNKQCKRRCGEDQSKEARDEEMLEEDVAALTPEQAADLFRQRIKEAEAHLHQLERSGRKEIIPVVASNSAGASGEGNTGKGRGADQEEGKRVKKTKCSTRKARSGAKRRKLVKTLRRKRGQRNGEGRRRRHGPRCAECREDQGGGMTGEMRRRGKAREGRSPGGRKEKAIVKKASKRGCRRSFRWNSSGSTRGSGEVMRRRRKHSVCGTKYASMAKQIRKWRIKKDCSSSRRRSSGKNSSWCASWEWCGRMRQKWKKEGRSRTSEAGASLGGSTCNHSPLDSFREDCAKEGKKNNGCVIEASFAHCEKDLEKEGRDGGR